MAPERAIPPSDRYAVIVRILEEILRRLATIELDIDALDRTMRPYGDGTRETRRRRR